MNELQDMRNLVAKEKTLKLFIWLGNYDFYNYKVRVVAMDRDMLVLNETPWN